MFQGIEGLSWNWIAYGVIFSIVFGIAAGNYACSLVHRLPRGKSILENKPYCGTCHTPLATKDLFPVISAVLLRHRCRYCGTPFPTSHTWTEILLGVLFIACFFAFNFNEMYFLVAALGAFWITLVCIEINDRIVMDKILLVIAVIGMVLRTRVDGEIYGFLGGGFGGLIAGMLLFRKQVHRVNHIYSFPAGAKILVVAGICVGIPGFYTLIPLAASAYILVWVLMKLARSSRSVPLSLPVAASVMALMFG